MKHIRLTMSIFMLLTFYSLGYAQTPVTTDPDSTCAGSQGEIYMVNPVSTSTFNWSVTGTGHILHSTNTHQVTVDWSSIPGVDTLKVQQIDEFGCPADLVKLTVIRVAPPTAFAGVDATICSSGTYTISDATASSYKTLLWTSSGDGVFSDASVFYPTYTPGPNDIAAGSVTLTLTTNPIAPCSEPASDALVLTIVPIPIVNAGGAATICSNSTYTISSATASNYASLQWTTSGDGIFSNATALNPVYTPGPNDIAAGSVTLTLTATPNAPCSDPISDAATLTIIPAPVAIAGPDATLCWGEVYYLDNVTIQNATSITWTTSGTGTFDNPNLQNPTYTPSEQDCQNGNVTLTLTVTGTAPCSEAQSTRQLIYRPKPVTGPILHY
ncbi:MAG: hypothetical protein WHT22_10965 [Bacteroidales bacterium]